MKSNTTLALLLIFISLGFGVMIYAATRSGDLYINQWLDPIGGSYIRLLYQVFSTFIVIPQWLIYSLPDGLWMLSLTLSILMIWNFRLNKKSVTWLVAAFLLGICFEAFQGFHWLTGSFDLRDLMLISVGAMLPISFVFIKFRLCKPL